MMSQKKHDAAWRGTSDCRNCGMRETALFADLNEQDFDQIHAPIDHLQYRQGAALYQEGSRAAGIFTVRSGMIKLVRVSADGRQRIVRVLRAGDVAGLEALATSQYDCEAVALTDVAVCRIPLVVIHKLGASSTRLQMRLMQKWQQALKDADDWLADLNFGTARQRVSNYILKMRNQADDQTVMLFARDDMGAMLDLKLETVSREVSRLVREEIIEPLDKLGRSYRVRQPERLLAA
jgi:CRP-like cAMP-binding protein